MKLTYKFIFKWTTSWLVLCFTQQYSITSICNSAHRYALQEIENTVVEISSDSCDYIKPDCKLLKYCGRVARCKLYHTERKQKRNKYNM